MGNIFILNSATDSGGALHLQDSLVETISSDTNITSMPCFIKAKNLTMSETILKPLSMYFLSNTANQGGGMCLYNSMASLAVQASGRNLITQRLEFVHSDVCGPMPTESIGGCKYLVTDFSRCSSVYFMTYMGLHL